MTVRTTAILAIALAVGFTASQDPPACYDEGECTRSLELDDYDARDVLECRDICQENPACEYFTYFEEQESCLAFANCEDFSEGTCVGQEACFSGSRDCGDLVCWELGGCDGTIIDEVRLGRDTECQEYCRENEDCLWFTYVAEDSMCQILQDCPVYLPEEEGCTSCISGQRQCTPRREYEKVLVVAGYSSGYINDVEVLDLSKQSSNCDVLPDYPIALELMTGALLEGGSMVKVCGGWDLEDTYTSCYDLNAGSGAWREAEPMMQERYNHASSVVGDKWFITGGYDGSAILSSTEVWDGTSFTPGPELPFSMDGHCQITLNSTHIFFADIESTLQTFLFSIEDGTWTSLPELSRTYYNGACGLAKSEDQGWQLVVASNGFVEIFYMNSPEWWRPGPAGNFGQELVAVQLETTFLLVGGYNSDVGYFDTVVKYDPDTPSFEDSSKLEVPRTSPVAVALPDDFVSCEE